MNGEAVKELSERLRQPITIGPLGVIATPPGWQLHDSLAQIEKGPQPDTLIVTTLGAVRDYLKTNRDKLDPTEILVHVGEPTTVEVLGALDARTRAREVYVRAKAEDLTDGFLDRFMALDAFVIGLQTRFAESEARSAVLRLFSNVKNETIRTASDDGISQVLESRAGTVLVRETAVPNPVALQPFRTFREVTQPSSLFAVRVQPGRSGELPLAGIFEADGGSWRLDAVGRVRDWLAHELGEAIAVLG